MSQLPDRPDLDQVREAGQAVTGVLSAEARELIDGQYADRTHLRPVLAAVLAALPGLGPVTVQARTTLVSLVTPRRTFAVVQATTKNRVDLGLRLDDVPPGGRLLAARESARPPCGLACPRPATWTRRPLGGCGAFRRTPPAAPRAPPHRKWDSPIEGFDLPGLTCRRHPAARAITTFTSP